MIRAPKPGYGEATAQKLNVEDLSVSSSAFEDHVIEQARVVGTYEH